MAVHIIRLDDRDPSIAYSANTWGLAGNGHEYLHTTSRANRPGAFMRIPFNGTKVVLYGTIDSSVIGTLPHSLITLDNNQGLDFLAQQTDEVQYQQKFWESSDLTPGPHLLTVTITTGTTMRAAFSFDYAEYYPLDSANSSSVSTTSSSTSASTLPTSASSSDSSHASRSKSPAPIIAGAVCGVVALFAIILGVIFYARKKRRMKDPDMVQQRGFLRGSPSSNDRSITPFITAHNRDPSGQFMAFNTEQNSINAMSESRSATPAGFTQADSSSGQKTSMSGEGNQLNNAPLASAGVPPPRYESYRFPAAPAVSPEP